MEYQQLKKGLPCQLNDSLTIRLIRQNDFDDIVEMLGTPNVSKYLFFAPAPVEVYEAFFNPIIKNTQQAIEAEEWPENPTFIIRNNDERYMGMIGISQVMMLKGNFEVGHQLAEHAWGQGIGTLGCQFATQLAFEQLKAHKICADCYAGNIGSARVLEKSGYELEGRQQDYYKIDDHFDDRLLFGLTASQYKAHR
ncbi:GNAT family N-acetyltransferase [Photobacterium sp. SDRW27]|uniref:GNAT family N-acetyltransferase n=1 Tax=Photobacterium obscurum TaxID=2829490 RepID=UPI0022443E65|nr:GNAT family N-acetyltransferase [Photobacterium obscurum]MCW8328391.1 GNAT family N-acetyltransferase [Photobacterium obscurum]